MSLDGEISLAAGVLIIFVLLFAYVLKKLAYAFTRYFSHLERKTSDIAIYLSHMNEDKGHIEKLASRKVESQWARENLSAAFSDFRSTHSEKGRVRLIIGSK